MHDLLKKLQDQLEYCVEANRRATFKAWVFSEEAKCSASKLAEAGFIFTGSKHEPDAVKCFFCNKSLDCWDEDDNPWQEHQKHAPACSFAKMDKPEKAFTLSEFVDLRYEFMKNFLTNLFSEQLDKNEHNVEDIVQLINSLK